MRRILCGVCFTPLIAYAGPAFAQEAPDRDQSSSAASGDSSKEKDIVVVGDRVGLLEVKPSATVLGFDKPLIETPRSATLISEETVNRYGIESVEGMTAISPGTFTSTAYGVAGGLSVRGTSADNYFEGFKLVNNFGNYNMPVSATSRVDIVRGPPSPIYGAGKVGGFINLSPKTAQVGGKYLDRVQGETSVTYGGYNRYKFTGELGVPLKLGATDGGLYTYAEYDHGDEYYHGISPKRYMGQVALTLDSPTGWSYELTGMLLHADGEVQTIGWNRLTQDLVDNGTYITGQNTALTATPGVDYLTPNQIVHGGGINGAAYPSLAFRNASNRAGAGLTYSYNGVSLITDGRFPLTSGVGTTKLSRRTVYIGNNDYADTTTPTVYTGLTKKFDSGDALKLEGFFNYVNSKRFVSYGFPSWFRGGVVEGRLSYKSKTSIFDDAVSIETIMGISDRYSWGRNLSSSSSGVISANRRDLSVGATPTDSICNPFDLNVAPGAIPTNCLGWENDLNTTVNNYGAFLTSDIEVLKRLNVTVGGRYDHYRVAAQDTGINSFVVAGRFTNTDSRWTYMASVSYKLPFGFMPYATYARSNAMQFNSGTTILVGQVRNGGWIRDSTLKEAGLKFQLLNGKLVGSFAYYEQSRPQLVGLPPNQSSVMTTGKGEELEIRWVATRNLSFTFAGNIQKTIADGPAGSTTYIPPSVVCGKSAACLISLVGGTISESLATLRGPGPYELTQIPRSVWSAYANYTTDEHKWGKAGVTWGVTRTGQTSGLIPDPVILPSYYVSNLSAFYQKGPWQVSVNVNNLFDKLYFTPSADTAMELSALPAKGRLWRLTIGRSF